MSAPQFSSYDPLLQTLLTKRGISSDEEAYHFLNPDYERHTHDPFLLADMEKAVERIKMAVAKNEHIAIWSDYDTDGIPGAVILHDFFKKIGYANFENYIPHRTLEGFGLNVEGIDEIGSRGSTLIITIDCGITDSLQVTRANELGIDVIITDHHLLNGEMPKAFAIINPKRFDCTYPEKMLCGSGVIYKLVQALAQNPEWKLVPGYEKWLLDMAGIATLSDMVPLRGENRVLARFGLTVLRKSRRPGLQTLLRKLKIDQRTLTEDDIGFMIAPRINAASRMGVPQDAFRLLATDDTSEADILAAHLDKINNERKGHVAAMVKEAKHRLDSLNEIQPVIVLGSIDWKPSLLGLVANTLVESYQRPVFVWGKGEGAIIKGSCRSDGSVNLVTLMGGAREIFIDLGGHAFAGGFSITNGELHHLEARLVAEYPAARDAESNSTLKNPDADITLSDVSDKTCRILECLAPFGEGNPKPIFAIRGVKLASVRQFGKEENHLELLLEDNDSRRRKKAIAFFRQADSFKKPLVEGEFADILATIERSSFAGKTEIRLRLVDVL